MRVNIKALLRLETRLHRLLQTRGQDRRDVHSTGHRQSSGASASRRRLRRLRRPGLLQHRRLLHGSASSSLTLALKLGLLCLPLVVNALLRRSGARVREHV